MLEIGVIEFRSLVSLPEDLSNHNQRVTFDPRFFHLLGNIAQRTHDFSFFGPGGLFDDRDRCLFSVPLPQLIYHPLDLVNAQEDHHGGFGLG